MQQEGHEKCTFHLGARCKNGSISVLVLTFEKFVAHLLPAYLDGLRTENGGKNLPLIKEDQTHRRTARVAHLHMRPPGMKCILRIRIQMPGICCKVYLFAGASAAADLIALLISLLAVIRCQRCAKRFSAIPKSHKVSGKYIHTYIKLMWWMVIDKCL